MTARPWCCPEPARCEALHQLQDHGAQPLDVPQPGESFICFGRCSSISFSYDGVEHENDLRSCHYTPLKGLILWQENAADWEVISQAYVQALIEFRRPL